MTKRIAYLGPEGTYAETAAQTWVNWLLNTTGESAKLCPYPSIPQALQATANGEAEVAIVPVENSIQGSVTMTLDALWNLTNLQVHQALVIPVNHALLSKAKTLSTIQHVYSHPQALSQCQGWLDTHLPLAQQHPMNSTTEALQHLDDHRETAGAIASQRAAELYGVPILAYSINDHPDNCTRFWVLESSASPGGDYTSLAFSLLQNLPGSLVKVLNIFAERGINMSRIESRPTKRSLGEYLFFVDLEANAQTPIIQEALTELASYIETLRMLGSYSILNVKSQP
jgi:prephenate dehydratase